MSGLNQLIGIVAGRIQPYDWEELIEKTIEAIDEFFRQHWD